MTPDQYCQELTGNSSSSFYYSFLFLPPERRRAINALYAFCREVDDVVDECSETDLARVKLAWWKQDVAKIYSGKPEHPVNQALSVAVKQFDLKQSLFNEIIDGMEMDLNIQRYENYDELKLYCYRAASVVGMLSAAIFGYQDELTLDYAKKLGLAFQLTNIIRDVGEDARRNRIYLPKEELERFNVTEQDIIQSEENSGFRQLMEFQEQRAQSLYTDAMAALPDVDRARQLPGLIMSAIYHALLDEIKNDGFHVLKVKTRLTPLRKLWIAWRTVVGEKKHVRKLNLQ